MGKKGDGKGKQEKQYFRTFKRWPPRGTSVQSEGNRRIHLSECRTFSGQFFFNDSRKSGHFCLVDTLPIFSRATRRAKAGDVDGRGVHLPGRARTSSTERIATASSAGGAGRIGTTILAMSDSQRGVFGPVLDAFDCFDGVGNVGEIDERAIPTSHRKIRPRSRSFR
jgi:hypothetical protein